MEKYYPEAPKTREQNMRMYDTYYQKPDWWFTFRYDTQVKRKTCMYLLRQVKRSIANQHVLEIGFGSGVVLFSFDPSCEVFGLEISHSAVERAKQKAKKLGYKAAEFSIVDGDLLPYPIKHFDVIIASHVVEHVEDDAKLLSEIGRTLKENGVAVVLIPINENYNDPNHLHRYTSHQFMALAEENLLVPIYHIENELLFHFVEKFYFEEYNRRWKILGPLIAALFNFSTSVLPFWMYQFLEKTMKMFGWKPRQLGCVFIKSNGNSAVGI